MKESGNSINWNSIESPPPEGGWYVGALNPKNFKELDVESINNWRESFGYTLVWFNPNAVDRWFEPDAHGQGCRPVKDRITHWAIRPGVPRIGDAKGGKR